MNNTSLYTHKQAAELANEMLKGTGFEATFSASDFDVVDGTDEEVVIDNYNIENNVPCIALTEILDRVDAAKCVQDEK